MAQYIDKDVLVAEIEKTINEPYPKHDQQCDWEDGYCGGLGKALAIIEDTLEVKEVDLEKVIEEYFKGWTDDYDNGGAACHYQYVQVQDCKAIAKRFFELGLKAARNNN